MSKYTPGPLITKTAEAGEGDAAIIDGDGKIIGEAFYEVDYNTYRPAEANARLWAKAPDLLAALKKIEETLTVPDLGEDEQAYMEFAFEAVDTAREFARDALAAAEAK